MQEEETINQCADALSSLGCVKSAEQLSLFAYLLSVAITKGKSADQLNVLGNFIEAVGAIVLTNAAQRESCETKQDKLNQIKELKIQIKEIENSLIK